MRSDISTEREIQHDEWRYIFHGGTPDISTEATELLSLEMFGVYVKNNQCNNP